MHHARPQANSVAPPTAQHLLAAALITVASRPIVEARHHPRPQIIPVTSHRQRHRPGVVKKGKAAKSRRTAAKMRCVHILRTLIERFLLIESLWLESDVCSECMLSILIESLTRQDAVETTDPFYSTLSPQKMVSPLCPETKTVCCVNGTQSQK